MKRIFYNGHTPPQGWTPLLNSSSFICLSEPSEDPRIHMASAKIGFEPGDELARAYLGSKRALMSERKIRERATKVRDRK